MSTIERDVRLQPTREADWQLIRSWLSRPDIQDWWGPLQTIEAEVMLAIRSEHAISRLILAAGVPVGYGHAVDATLWGDQLPKELTPGTWDIDLFIASETHRNQGIGANALGLLTAEVFATTLATAVCVFPSIANERAVRAYEKAGFQWQSVWQDPVLGASWFMIMERPSP